MKLKINKTFIKEPRTKIRNKKIKIKIKILKTNKATM